MGARDPEHTADLAQALRRLHLVAATVDEWIKAWHLPFAGDEDWQADALQFRQAIDEATAALARTGERLGPQGFEVTDDGAEYLRKHAAP